MWRKEGNGKLSEGTHYLLTESKKITYNISKFYYTLSDNTVSSLTDQPVNAVKWNNWCLMWESQYTTNTLCGKKAVFNIIALTPMLQRVQQYLEFLSKWQKYEFLLLPSYRRNVTAMCKKTIENGDLILLVITGIIHKIWNLSLMLDKP